MVLMDPYTPLYMNSMCFAGTGTVKFEDNRPFRIFVANFSDLPIDLLSKQILATALTHPDKLVESHMSFA